MAGIWLLRTNRERWVPGQDRSLVVDLALRLARHTKISLPPRPLAEWVVTEGLLYNGRMRDVELHLVLDDTLPGVRGGVQVGSGSAGMVETWHQMEGGEFRFVVRVQAKEGQLPLRGEAIQKDGKGRFVYIVWRDDTGVVSRRAKIYVETVDQAMLDTRRPLEVILPGKAKDGLPCCATVKPLRDWSPIR